MNIKNTAHLVCPHTLSPLSLTVDKQEGDEVIKGVFKSKDGTSYKITDGIADFTYPKELTGSDKDFNEIYEHNAKQYEEGMDWLFASFYETEDDVRNKLVGLLNLKPGSFVLNMGCGAGGDSKYIISHLGKKGELFHLDLTAGLLKIARKNLKDSAIPTEFFVGNGSYLPFPAHTFDCVFHFGGINMFSEKKRAIDEMVRVAKPNGRIVFGDESAPPWLSNKLFGKVIKNANPLYKHTPPMHMLPANARNVSLNYVLGNSFYAIAFNAGEEVRLNLDLPIPGKRGGTLRSRYEQTGKKIK